MAFSSLLHCPGNFNTYLAPKTRFTPAAQKGKSIVESSGSSKRARAALPTYETYLTPQAEERARLIEAWPFHREREVDLASIEITGVPEIIHAKGWEKFCAKPPKIYLPVVREFLANFNEEILGGDEDDEADHAFHTYVRGVWVPFSPSTINQFFHVEPGTASNEIADWNHVAHVCFHNTITPVWPKTNVVLHSELNLKAKILHYILSFNIAPSSHMTDIHPPRMQLIYNLAIGQDLNFGELIFQQIKSLALSKGRKKRIYFPALISALCKRAKVPTTSAELDTDKPTVINFSTIRQSHAQTNYHRHAATHATEEEEEAEELEEHDTPPPARPPPRRRPGGVNFGPTLEAMQAQIQANREDQDRQFQLLHANMDLLRADLRSHHEEMQAQFAQLMRSIHPPPPSEGD